MPTLIDPEHVWPWFDHLTLKEAGMVQGLRARYDDAYILENHSRLCPLILQYRVSQFMKRNPPPRRDAA